MKNSLTMLIEPPTLCFKEKNGRRKHIALPRDLHQLIQRTATDMRPDRSYWSGVFPGVENRRLNLVLPYYLYENKLLCSDLYDYFSTVFTADDPLIVPDIQFILKAQLQGNSNDPIIRIACVEMDHGYIHDIDVSDQKVKFQNTNRFAWQENSMSLPVDKETGQSSAPIITDTECLDRIFNEEFISLEEKYYIYRIDYASKITYEMLHRFFLNRATEFQQYISVVPGSGSVAPVFFIGSLATSSFFQHYFPVEKPIMTTEQYYNAVLDHDFSVFAERSGSHTSLSLKLFPEEAVAIDLPYSHPSIQPGQNLRYFRLLEPIGKESAPTLTLVSEDRSVGYQPSSECVRAIYTLPYFENRAIRWRNIGVTFAVDLCDNLIIDWYHQNKKVFSEIIGKI